MLRPHDIEVLRRNNGLGAVPGEVVRLLRVGFEVRLTVRPDDPAGHGTAVDGERDVSVVLTRSHARELGLGVGTQVWLAPSDRASTARSRRRAASATSA